jgi:photosystem II stability/assembly factor-like uncharacterized protein
MNRWLSGISTCLFLSASSVLSATSLPAGAYITDIALDPANPDSLWVTTNGAGRFFREGLDAPWQRMDGHADSGKWYAIAGMPGMASTVLTGGEQSGPPLGPDGQRLSILDIAAHPTDSGVAFVLTPGGVWRVSDPADMRIERHWKQVFDYARWLAANRQADWPDRDWRFTRFQKLTVDPHAPDTLLLGARWEGGYHRSDDGGRTWTHHSISGIFRRVDELRVDPFNPQLFYAFTHHQGLFKSYNRGQSWVVAGSGLLPQKRTPHYGVYLLGGIAFDPNTPGRILSGSDYSTWLSEDYGESWTEVGPTLTCEFVRATAFHPENPDILYAGSNVGFFQSMDGGKTWTPANRGFPERRILQTLEVDFEGRPFEFARVAGGNPVYRRPLDQGPDAPWRSMSWLLNTGASDLSWNPDTAELVLTSTDGQTLTSADGGFRWTVPEVIYADRSVRFPEGEIPAEASGGDLVIQNAVVPDPEPLLHWYKRPPFVSIQLVGPGYPEDGSAPRWQTNWDTRLSGTLDIPEEVDTTDAVIYVEVRDFQDGTRAGKAPYHGPDVLTEVVVKPAHP